jgi:uncharacterized protein YacL
MKLLLIFGSLSLFIYRRKQKEGFVIGGISKLYKIANYYVKNPQETFNINKRNELLKKWDTTKNLVMIFFTVLFPAIIAIMASTIFKDSISAVSVDTVTENFIGVIVGIIIILLISLVVSFFSFFFFSFIYFFAKEVSKFLKSITAGVLYFSKRFILAGLKKLKGHFKWRQL